MIPFMKFFSNCNNFLLHHQYIFVVQIKIHWQKLSKEYINFTEEIHKKKRFSHGYLHFKFHCMKLKFFSKMIKCHFLPHFLKLLLFLGGERTCTIYFITTLIEKLEEKKKWRMCKKKLSKLNKHGIIIHVLLILLYFGSLKILFNT